MSSASIAVYRIQAACFVGRGDGKLAQRVREFQQLRGLGMLRDNRVGIAARSASPTCVSAKDRHAEGSSAALAVLEFEIKSYLKRIRIPFARHVEHVDDPREVRERNPQPV